MHLREQRRVKRRRGLARFLNRGKDQLPRPIEHEVDPNTGRRTRKQTRLQAAVGALLPDTQKLRRQRSKNWLLKAFDSWWHPGKYYSLSTLVLACLLFVWLSYGERWFVYAEDVHFAGQTYLEETELYESSGLHGFSAFWLDPEEIHLNLQEHPYVTDNSVTVQLPAQIDVQVQQIQPIALWMAAEQEKYWLLEDGTALPIRGPIDHDLMQIIDLKQEAKDVERLDHLAIDSDVLYSSFVLRQHLPKVTNLRYNKQHGLHFYMPDKLSQEAKIAVVWGDGHNLEKKLENFTAIRKSVDNGEISPVFIDLRSLTRPYFR